MQATKQASQMCPSHPAVTSIFSQRTCGSIYLGAGNTAPQTYRRRSTSSTYLRTGRTVETLSGRLCVGSNRTLYAGTRGIVWSENLLNARGSLVGVGYHPTRSNSQASVEGQQPEKPRGKAPRKKGTRTGGAVGRGRITPAKTNPTKWSDDLATGILADLIKGQKVASVLEVHRETITAQCLRDLLKKVAQSKHPRVASEVCHLHNQ
jgi:hypothetical protein